MISLVFNKNVCNKIVTFLFVVFFLSIPWVCEASSESYTGLVFFTGSDFPTFPTGQTGEEILEDIRLIIYQYLYFSFIVNFVYLVFVFFMFYVYFFESKNVGEKQ